MNLKDDDIKPSSVVDDDSDLPQKTRKRKNPFNLQQIKEERERRQKKRARIIVRNISFKTTEETLRKHFEQWGKLEDVNVLKKPDGKLVGCAFIQYETINQATKAILKANGQELLGRSVYVDWAVGKDEYKAKQQNQEESASKRIKSEDNDEIKSEIKQEDDEAENSVGDENDKDDISTKSAEDNVGAESDVEADTDRSDDDGDGEDDGEEEKKTTITRVAQKKHISNDVQEGCTVFIKNVPFRATDEELRKVVRKYGPVYYAIINREPLSGHSKGTAFVKFKRKESADMCLGAGTDFTLLDEVLDPLPALSREEIKRDAENKKQVGKDSRNLYLAREGLIMAGSKAAEGVSASDMAKRLKLERIKTQVLKNLNRFVSRNRLSIHNLPLSYDDEKLKELAIKHTGFRPHECRVMRENKVTAEHPNGKSKGFGFLSFSTHQDALSVLRKLNNNPKIFGPQNRPIVAFSIEDRAVHKLKENRMRKSKLSNPTYKDKLEKSKLKRKQKLAEGKVIGKLPAKAPQSDSKERLQNHLKKLEVNQAKKNKKQTPPMSTVPEERNYVGMAAKPGGPTRMRSHKKITEQAKDHMKRIKTEKRQKKKKQIQKTHLAERKAMIRPKQGKKKERDDLAPLINKYKQMISSRSNEGSVGNPMSSLKKPKRTKWYTE